MKCLSYFSGYLDLALVLNSPTIKMVHPLASEKIWFDKSRVEEAESNYYSRKYSGAASTSSAVSINQQMSNNIAFPSPHSPVRFVSCGVLKI